MTDSLLKEVDNALKWHRLQRLWQRSGRQIILFVAVAVIALISLLLYKQQQLAQAQQQSDRLLRGLSQLYEAPADGAAALDTSALSGSFAQLGNLILAAQNWQKNQTDASLGHLQKAITAPNGTSLLQDYACLLTQFSQSQAASGCMSGQTFSSLLIEPRILQALASQDAQAAFALLPPAAPIAEANREPARIAMLRAYLRSRSDAPATLEETAELPHDDSSQK